MKDDKNHKVYKMSIGRVYPLYVAKVERKGRTRIELDKVICWLTGYSQKQMEVEIKKETDFETFFASAPNMNPKRTMIKGVICGVRIDEIKEQFMREIRYMDKLVDDLAKGRKLEKILFDNIA